MATVCKTLGGLLLAVGLAGLVAFASFVLRDEKFGKARLMRERNPGNVMYESEYFVAATVRGFLIGGAVAGGLLALNGTTLLLVGMTAARIESGREDERR
jgi:hypothetical protein